MYENKVGASSKRDSVPILKVLWNKVRSYRILHTYSFLKEKKISVYFCSKSFFSILLSEYPHRGRAITGMGDGVPPRVAFISSPPLPHTTPPPPKPLLSQAREPTPRKQRSEALRTYPPTFIRGSWMRSFHSLLIGWHCLLGPLAPTHQWVLTYVATWLGIFIDLHAKSNSNSVA